MKPGENAVPLFPYYGSKWRMARRYPAPRHDVIVEPFAGSACYALHHAERQVLLVERDPRIAAIWRWLLTVEPEGIFGLPDLASGASLRDPEYAGLSDVEQWYVGMHLGAGDNAPRHRRSPAMDGRGLTARRRDAIAAMLPRIRHWRVVEGDYTEAAQIERGPATWFIDPPYSGRAGARYRFSDLDYVQLGAWSLERAGQVIVCEAGGADWLPFVPVRHSRGINGRSVEAVYTRVTAADDLADAHRISA